MVNDVITLATTVFGSPQLALIQHGRSTQPEVQDPRPDLKIVGVYGSGVTKTLEYIVTFNKVNLILEVQRMKLCRSDLPANDAIRRFNAPPPSLISRFPILRHCDASVRD
ncbi:hypothetical protein EVAR_26818_1 [Eumeta japonica]|uniref:Uncharacterized protein n=1 Tax=Eumeta variegata TaxID=151549 RepID=A0A4C1WFD6_EUMVA|nr:hypothetical protein EVAR_26818_1 [Eumeta japonica]